MLQSTVEEIIAVLGKGISAAIMVFDRHTEHVRVEVAAGARPLGHLLTPPRKDGLGVQAMQQRVTAIANRPEALSPTAREDGVLAAMAVPLLEEDRVLGVLYLDSIEKSDFLTPEIETAQAYALRAVAEIRNARYTRQLRALTDVGSWLHSLPDFEASMSCICQKAVEVLDVDSSCILLIAPEDGEQILHVRGHYGLGQRFIEETRIPLGSSIAGRVVASREPLIISDVAADNRLENPAAAGEGFRAILSVPVWLDDQVIGTLDIQSKTRAHVFSSDDHGILKIMAGQVAIAIRHADLYRRYNRLVSTAPEGIIGVDENGQVIEWNQAAETLLGYTTEEAKTIHVTHFYQRGREEAQQINQRLHQNPEGRLDGYETTIRNVNGQEIPIRLSAALYEDHAGQIRGSFGYFRDLREFTAVDEFVQSLLKLTDPQSLTQRIAETVAHQLETEICLLFVYSHQVDALQVEGISGLPREARPGTFDLETTAAGKVFLSQQTLHLSQKDLAPPALLEEFSTLRIYLPGHEIRNLLAVPLVYQDETFGVLLLINKIHSHRKAAADFSQADEALIERLAYYLGGLLNRARYRAGLKALLKISEDIMTVFDEKAVLEKIVHVVVNAFGYRMAYFKQLEPDRSLTLQAASGVTKDFLKSINFTTPPNRGIVSQVVRERRVIPVPDLSKREDFHFQAVRAQEKWGAMLGLPLMGDDGEVIGVLACYTARPHNFGNEETDLVANFVGLAAVALQNARLFGRTQQQLEEVRTLYRVSRSLITDQRLPNLLQTIVDSILSAFEADRVILILADSQAQEIKEFVPAGRQIEELRWLTYPELIEGLSGWVLETGQAAHSPKGVPDGRESLRVQEMRHIAETGAILVTPLRYHGEIFGTITVIRRYNQPDFSDDELKLLEVMGNQAAVVIKNAELVEYEKQRNATLETLHSASKDLISHLKLAPLLKKLIENVVNLINADGAHVFLYQADQLKCVAAYWDGRYQPTPYQNKAPGPQGVTYRVARQGEKLIIPSIRNHPDFQDWKRDGALICLPLRVGQRICGTLNLGFETPRHFGASELHLLDLFAAYAAIVINNARHYERQERLEKAGEALARLIEWREVLKATMEHLPVEADGGFVCLYNPVSKKFEPDRAAFFGIGQTQFFWNPTKPRPGSLLHSLLNQEYVVVEDVRRPDFHFEERLRKGLLKAGIQAFIGLRLKAGDHFVGALFVNFRQPLSEQEFLDEIAILRIFANQAAEALHRAGLYYQKQQKQQLLEAIARAINTFKDMQSIWETILSGAREITGAERGNISLANRATGEITYPAISGIPARSIRIDQGIQGLVARIKQPVLIANVHAPQWRNIYHQGVEDTVSELTVPILRGETQELLGMINLESPREGAFDQDDQELVVMLAHFAQIAVQNLKRFEQLNAFNRVAEAILKVGLELDKVFQVILQATQELTEGYFITLWLCNEEEDELELKATWPDYYMQLLTDKHYPTLPLDGPGITTKTFRSNEPCLVPDVSLDPDYIQANEETRSELAVPVCLNGKPIGVINTEHRDIGGLDEEDLRVLIALANLAAVAIQAARQAQELSLSHTLAFVSAWGAEIAHDVNRIVGHIRREIRILDLEIKNTGVTQFSGSLQEIDHQASELSLPEISDHPIEPGKNIRYEDASPLDDVIRIELNSLCQKFTQCSIAFTGQGGEKKVAIHPTSLRHILRNLVSNAHKAIPNDQALKKIEVQTMTYPQWAEIRIQDNGRGVDPAIVPRLFKHPIMQADGRNSYGLLIVGSLVTLNGGTVQFVRNDETPGACFVVRLPLSSPDQNGLGQESTPFH